MIPASPATDSTFGITVTSRKPIKSNRYSALTEFERFWGKVLIGDGCWEWIGAKSDGYGHFVADGRCTFQAHRFSYELFIGHVPEGLILDHLCRNRACVRPDHLEPVTQYTNKLRGYRPTKPTCDRGHLYSYRSSRGKRVCRECNYLTKAIRRGRMPGPARPRSNSPLSPSQIDKRSLQ